MLWILTFVYFVVWAPITWLGLDLYAKALLKIGQVDYRIKLLAGFVAYLACACFVVLPLYLSFSVLPEVRVGITSGTAFTLYFTLCYLLSAIPGISNFSKHHLKELQGAGYFLSRFNK
jgi:hypothetical protein